MEAVTPAVRCCLDQRCQQKSYLSWRRQQRRQWRMHACVIWLLHLSPGLSSQRSRRRESGGTKGQS